MSDLPDAIRQELDRISQLPRNKLGPIPDKYETLQGITFIREVYRLINREVDAEILLQRVLYCCMGLITLNVSQLFLDADVALRAPRKAIISRAAAKLRWSDYILEIAADIASTAKFAATTTNLTLSKRRAPFLDRLKDAFNHLGESINSIDTHRDNYIRTSIHSGYLDNSGARLVHAMKNVSWHLTVIEGSYFIDEIPDEDSVLDITELAGSSLDIAGETYFQQFRLLHQLPELLSFFAVDRLDEACAFIAENRVDRAAQSMRLVNAILPIVIKCLRPLVDLMYPSEYYKIREHLGPTSGSHSKDLGAMLLARKYDEIANLLKHSVAVPSDQLDYRLTALRWEFLDMRQYIYKWREMHVMLPRNVLGSGATSLMGTKNATVGVEKMLGGFARRDPIDAPPIPDTPEEMLAVSDADPMLESGRSAEQRLLRITGEITRGSFPDVEGRRGPIFGRK